MSLAATAYALSLEFECPYEKLAMLAVCDGAVDGMSVVSAGSVAKWACCDVRGSEALLSRLLQKNLIGYRTRDDEKDVFDVVVLDLAVVRRPPERKKNSSVPLEIRKAVYERDGPICYYCGIGLSDGGMTLDHLLPQSRGGSHKVDNLVVCCRACNSSKGTKTEEEFLAYLSARLEV